VAGQESRMIYGFQVQEFKVVNVPFVVEGKRPPSRSNILFEQKPLEALVDQFMGQGKTDIGDKMPYFFSAHPSDSYIGIAYSGPWWAFTICTPGATTGNLRWSKAFVYHSHQSELAMSTLFNAAQNFPQSPQKDLELLALLTEFEETRGSFTFVL
jgi:hypothetical protein